MKISDLLDKIAEANVNLWEMKEYSLVVRDSTGKELKLEDLKVNSDNKTIRIKVK